MDKKFVGFWRIIGLSGYDAYYVDLSVPAILKISARGTGRFDFGAVEAEMDCKMDDLDPRASSFTFSSSEDGDPISGRGYCLVDYGQLIGRMFCHFGDEFSFKAERLQKGKAHAKAKPV